MDVDKFYLAVSDFIAAEVMPAVTDPFTKFVLGGLVGVAGPILLDKLKGSGAVGENGVDVGLLRNFCEAGFKAQPTLTLRLGDLVDSEVMKKYPILQFSPAKRILAFSVEIDKDSMESFLKRCE